MHSETVNHQLGVCSWLMDTYTEGLTNDESLKPSATGNTINWLVGHLADARNGVTALLKGEPLWPREELARYVRGSSPLTSGDALPLEDLLARYRRSTAPLAEAIAAVTPEKLAEKSPVSPTGNPDETIGTLLSVIAFHESYHLGQIGLLRRQVGKPGIM